MQYDVALIFDIVEDADLIRRDTGTLTTRDIIHIKLRHNAPSLKWTFDVLVENRRAPRGCYDRLLERGFRVRDGIAQVRAEMEAENATTP